MLATLAALALVGVASANGPTNITVNDFIRMRCSTDGADTITAWRGVMYSNVPQEKQKAMFGLTGMNIASCFQNKEGQWFLSSRELMYYTHPDDLSQPLSTWHNPWTEQDVTVMHVANSPVQTPLGAPDDLMAAELLAGGTIISKPADVNLYYPNPLATNATFAPYSPQKMYEGGEFFKFFASTVDLAKSSPSIPATWFSWERTSQWLPWMGMGDRPGGTFCSTTGSRVAGLTELPDFIQRDIAQRLQLYAQAPHCILDEADSTSWTYFAEHFASYLRGDQFPVPAPNVSVACKWKPVPHHK